MGILRGLLYVLYKNRRFKKLIIPVMFFFTELGMFVFLSIRLWGNMLRIFSDKFNENTVNKSMLVVKFLSPHKFAGHIGTQDPIHKLTSTGFVFVSPDMICNLLSILCTFAGLLIAYLWIARFFKMNNLNVNWWVWLAGCLGGHAMFYFISLV
ncbi:MAG TPA: hypothetical protein VNW99_09735 [Cytophagaceae bacterium]|jgi:hypothetical protein|nr:hypothetical protein [Cytophagaceae bacterium]